MQQSLAELEPEDRRLAEAALTASANAYAPYSGFAVGAAVRARSGSMYVGANLENASYGLALCAEAAAVAAASSAGEFEIEAIAVAGHRFLPPADATRIVTPCGRCRQIIAEAAELAGRDLRVLCCSGDLARIEVTTIAELLPHSFGPQTLGIAETWADRQRLLRAAVARLARPPS